MTLCVYIYIYIFRKNKNTYTHAHHICQSKTSCTLRSLFRNPHRDRPPLSAPPTLVPASPWDVRRASPRSARPPRREPPELKPPQRWTRQPKRRRVGREGREDGTRGRDDRSTSAEFQGLYGVVGFGPVSVVTFVKKPTSWPKFGSLLDPKLVLLCFSVFAGFGLDLEPSGRFFREDLLQLKLGSEEFRAWETRSSELRAGAARGEEEWSDREENGATERNG